MKLKRYLFCLALCAMFFCLASCGNGNKAFEQADKNGCTVRVTYDLGNGTVNGNSELLYCVAPDALLPEPGKVTGTTEPILVGYHLLGYYTKDTSGNETEWDFAKDRAGGDITLYAKWEKDVVLKTYTVQIFYGDSNEKSYSLSSFTSEKPTLSSFRKEDWSGHTFYGFYYDEAYTQPVEFPYTHGLSDDAPIEKVYAKYLSGVYTVIRTADDFKGRIEAGTKYYLDADINLTGVTMTVDSDFSGAFIGNGHTVTGLSVTKKQQRVVNGYGLFNTVSAGAVFKDVIFADVSVKVVLDNEQNTMINYVGGFAGIVNAGATFENVAVSGKLTCDKSGRTFEDGKLTVDASFGECDPAVALDSFAVDVTVEFID